MNMRYLQEIRFRWDRLDADSYVRSIPSFQNLGSLVFDRNVTLFSGENGTGNPPSWKLSPSPLALIRRAEPAIIIFPPMSPIPASIRPCFW